MSRRALTSVDDFNYWMVDMDDALDRFFARFPDDLRRQLDYSPASLDIVEQRIMDRFPDPKQMLEAEHAQEVDGAARYVGETLRKTVGGHWDIELDNPKNAYFGLPIVTGYEERPTPACPLTLTTASAHRRTGSYLRTVVQNIADRVSASQGG